MKIKNIEIEKFVEFIMSLELKGRESRLRTRFARLLVKRQSMVQEEHLDLIKQFANKDTSGEPVILTSPNGLKYYDIPERVTFNREYALLMNENFIIAEDEERKEMFLLLKDVILNCDKTFKDEEALMYDRWCEIVEEINYGE